MSGPASPSKTDGCWVRLVVCIAVWIGLVPALGSAEVIRHTTPTGRVFYYVQMPEADRTAIVVDWKSAWAYGAEHPTAARMGAALMTIGGTEHTLGSKGDCPAAAVGESLTGLQTVVLSPWIRLRS